MTKREQQSATQQQAVGGIVGFAGACLGIYVAIFSSGSGGLAIIAASMALGWYLTFRQR